MVGQLAYYTVVYCSNYRGHHDGITTPSISTKMKDLDTGMGIICSPESETPKRNTSAGSVYRADYAEIVKSMKVIERVIHFRWYPNRNAGNKRYYRGNDLQR